MIAETGIMLKVLDTQKMKSTQRNDQGIGYEDVKTSAMKKTWADDYYGGGTMTCKLLRSCWFWERCSRDN